MDRRFLPIPIPAPAGSIWQRVVIDRPPDRAIPRYIDPYIIALLIDEPVAWLTIGQQRIERGMYLPLGVIGIHADG